MKIQFSPISFIKPKNNSEKKHFNFIQYNRNLDFDTISFTGKKTLTQQIKELPSNAFLSDGLRNYIMDNINQKNILDLHKEYYAPLMYCNTLDEAKKLYPEFLNVVDINDIDLNKTNNRTVKKIANGEIKGLSKENASLLFLQKYIGRLEPLKGNEEQYFNINYHTMEGLLKYLNISMDKDYKDIIKKYRMSQTRKNIWQNEDFKQKALTERKTSKARQKHSQAALLMWQNEQYRQKRITEKQSRKNKTE